MYEIQDEQAIPVTKLGQKGRGPGELMDVTDLIYDQGHLYTADNELQRINDYTIEDGFQAYKAIDFGHQISSDGENMAVLNIMKQQDIISTFHGTKPASGYFQADIPNPMAYEGDIHLHADHIYYTPFARSVMYKINQTTGQIYQRYCVNRFDDSDNFKKRKMGEREMYYMAPDAQFNSIANTVGAGYLMVLAPYSANKNTKVLDFYEQSDLAYEFSLKVAGDLIDIAFQEKHLYLLGEGEDGTYLEIIPEDLLRY
ncbi:MAG: hypothetical protein ACQETE_00260 [Bacteroidota bacterium]